MPLFCDHDLEINPMTLKLKGYPDTLKMYIHTENEAASLRHSKLRAWIKKYRNMSEGQKSRSECQKLQITSSIIAADIPVKPQEFPTSSFLVARYQFSLPWP